MNDFRETALSLKGKETFVLIHGAFGGAWVWDMIKPILCHLGHDVIAVDLPGHGLNAPETLADQTIDTYADYVVRVIERLDRPVILVGHSMGGATVSAVAERIPEKLKKLVYVAAFLVGYGESTNGPENGFDPVDWAAISGNDRVMDYSVFGKLGVSAGTMAGAILTDIQDRSLAGESIAATKCPVYPTEERWGSVPRYYIAGAYDTAISAEMTQRMLDARPCREVYLVDSDHNIMDTRPEELAFILHHIALQDACGQPSRGFAERI